MAKKNIVVMLVMTVLLVGSVLFADTISFNESKDVAFNLQGYINVYENNTGISHRAAFESIVVTLYQRDNDGNETTNKYYLTTDSNGNYFLNFDPASIHDIYRVAVYFRGSMFYENYDYDVDPYIRIDINWWKAF